MSFPLTPVEAEFRLKKVSALRALFHRLPRIPNKKSDDSLAEFRLFAAGATVQCSINALRAGFEELWREGDFTEIVRVGRSLPPKTMDADRTLQTYFSTAERIANPIS